jgi:hypothetical protein
MMRDSDVSICARNKLAATRTRKYPGFYCKQATNFVGRDLDLYMVIPTMNTSIIDRFCRKPAQQVGHRAFAGRG